ncbi:MAG: ribosome biogenesis GTP-binding protein YihA/YsxC [Chitinophagales bacterium]|nr:YihA family ribosome biogenesis GTP-binding protein [Bacteroidota bacterium]
MIIHTATFEGSFTQVSKLPETSLPEYAFVGRSNVGKSSLINLLTSNKKLAKVSGTPGKTQCINYFLINGKWHLVDLPGYGYARVSQKKRAEWASLYKQYLTKRPHLVNVFVLIDVRIPPQKIDLEFINNLGEWQIPFSLVFTKTDKLKENACQKNIQLFLNTLSETWEMPPPYFLSSAVNQVGKTEILAYIDQCNAELMGEDFLNS